MRPRNGSPAGRASPHSAWTAPVAPPLLALLVALMALAGCLFPVQQGQATEVARPATDSIAEAFVLPDEDAAIVSTPTQRAPAGTRLTAGTTPTRTPRLQPTASPTQTPTRTPRTQATAARTPKATTAANAPTSFIPTPERGERLALIPYADLPIEAKETLALIQQGGPFPYRQDGVTFQNRERLLPARPSGYYREYTVETPGSRDRGARRLVRGQKGELYYTDDHYDSFRRVVP